MIGGKKAFREHPVHQRLDDVSERLRNLRGRSDYQQIRESVSQIARAVRYVRNRLTDALPSIVPKSHLDNLHNQGQQIVNLIDQFTNDNNPDRINNNAMQHGANLVAAASQLPITRALGQGNELSKILEDNERESKALIDELSEYSKSLNQKLDNLEQSRVAVQAKLDQLTQESQQMRERLDNLISQQQDQFASDQKKRWDEFSELSKNLKTEQQDLLSSATDQVDEVLTALKEKEEKAAELVQIIGNIGVTGNYQKVADRQRRAANWLRAGAIVFMLLLVVFVAGSVIMGIAYQHDWKLTLLRVVSGLVFAVPAGYCAVESSRHRRNEEHARRLELELASLDPFLQNLADDKQSNLKEELAKRYFGADDAEVRLEDVPPTSLIDLLRDAIKALGKFR